VNRILNIFSSNLLLSLIFINYIIYFVFDTSIFFIYFSSIILLVFFLILYSNLKLKLYIVLTILILSIISLGSPVSDWDARSIWLFNSKRIFFNQSLNEYTNYIGSEFSHLDYPILVQTLSASLAKLIGNWNEIFPKYSSIIMALPAFIIISDFLKNKIDKLIFFILIFFIYEKRLINGDMDALLGLYTISSLILLINFSKISKFNFNNYFTLFLFLMTLTMIKVEGLAIFFCLVISYLIVFYNHHKKSNNYLILIFGISLIPIITWKIFIYDKDVISSSYLMISNGERFIDNLINFKFILVLIKHILLNKQMFISLILFLFALSKYFSINKNTLLLMINKNLFKKEIIFIFFSILSYGSILFLVFIMSEGSPNNYSEIEYFMTKSSSDRLFLPVHSLLVICSIYLNRNIINSK
tara:strand:+ start:355 stop:1596 length:1242 start_codon:yes stop_codon:yes gene_type:complete